MEKEKIKNLYSVLKLKEQAPIQDVIKSYHTELKSTEGLNKQYEICYAYCSICNERQNEFYEYHWNIFLQNYQALINSPEKIMNIIKKINGEL